MPLATFCSIGLRGTQHFRMSLCADQGIARTFNTINLLPHFDSICLVISSKAVSDGAILYNIDHLVKTRVAKHTYGVVFRDVFDPSLSDHTSREHTKTHDLDGHWRLPDAFRSMVKKVLQPCDCIMIYKA